MSLPIQPTRRVVPLRTERITWTSDRLIRVPPFELSNLPFSSIMHTRRSRRQLTRAPIRESLALLNEVTKPVFISTADDFGRRKTPTLSAGALGSVTPLLLSGVGKPRLFRPCPTQFAAEVIDIRDVSPLHDLRCSAHDLIPTANGSDLIVIICDIGILDACYENIETLMWRESGAMLQMLSLASTAYGLGFCPLGILGTEITSAIITEKPIAAVGTAYIGI